MARSIAIAVAAVLLISGCTRVAPATTAQDLATPVATAVLPPELTPPPTPIAGSLPTDLDPDLAHAVAWRRSFGLRYDLSYVRTVAEDPRASDEPYGVALYPEELKDMQARSRESQHVAEVVQRYADGQMEEFGGLYIEESNHAGVVSLWTGHVAEHAATIRRLAGAGSRVAFGHVRYSEHELRTLQERISLEWREGWVAAIPASMQSVGVDIFNNRVAVTVSSADPDAAAIVEAHFDAGDRLRVESDGTGAALLPWGTVMGRVTPFQGIDLRETTLVWTSTDPGDCGGGDMGYGVGSDGTFELPCQVGLRTIKLAHIGSDGIDAVLGSGTVEVFAGKSVRLTIHIQAVN